MTNDNEPKTIMCLMCENWYIIGQW
jgi:hypothetical protein